MLEKLQSLDASLLLFFNHLNNPVFDFLFYWISNKWVWVPFYGYLTYVLYTRHRRHFFTLLLFIAATIAVSDQISSSLIKDSVMRFRPCHDPMIASEVHIVNGYCGGLYGFVSSHASNVFTLTLFLNTYFRKRHLRLQGILIVWATVVSFSRIYLGAHFPGDVLCGAALGALIGLASARSYRYYEVYYETPKKYPPHNHTH